MAKPNVHAEFYEIFLDHSAVAKQHYMTSGEPVPRFDEAVKHFGGQMGFLTNELTKRVTQDTVESNAIHG